MCRGPNNHTPAQKKKRRQQTHCSFCEKELSQDAKSLLRATIDHFYPVVLGKDLNRTWNKIIICRRCNAHKGQLTPNNYILKVKNELTYQKNSKFLQKIINNVSRYRDELEGWYLMKDVI